MEELGPQKKFILIVVIKLINIINNNIGLYLLAYIIRNNKRNMSDEFREGKATVLT